MTKSITLDNSQPLRDCIYCTFYWWSRRIGNDLHNQGGGGEEVHVGETPPEGADTGALWFCTKEDDGSMYVNIGTADEPKWVSSSPPVSLDGVSADIANIDQTLMQTRADLFQTDNDLRDAKLDIGDLQSGKINNTGNNKVTSETDKEWRIQGEKKTFIKVNDANQTIGIFNLQGATEDHHAISRGWVKDHTVQLKGNNKVESGWKVQSGDKTHLHVEGGTTRIYYLQDPSHPQHPVNLQYADKTYAKKGDVGGSEGATARHGNEQNPVLNTGELYLRTTDNVLLIGV